MYVNSQNKKHSWPMFVTVILATYFVNFRVEVVSPGWCLTAKQFFILNTVLSSRSSDSLACGRHNNGPPRMFMS